MATYSNWIEFRARDGSLIAQRAEDISTVIETEVPQKSGPPRVETYLLLANNNKVSVINESRESILAKIRHSTGVISNIIAEDVIEHAFGEDEAA